MNGRDRRAPIRRGGAEPADAPRVHLRGPAGAGGEGAEGGMQDEDAYQYYEVDDNYMEVCSSALMGLCVCVRLCVCVFVLLFVGL